MDSYRVDVWFVEPDKANQVEAERLYLKFIEGNPESELVSYLYFHVGHMFSSKVQRDWKEKYGHVKDYERAFRYFDLSAKHHAGGKVSCLLIESRVNAASLAATSNDRLDRYIATYRFLRGLEKESLPGILWISGRETKVLITDSDEIEKWLRAFWKRRNQMMEVIELNLVALGKSRVDGEPISKLGYIESELRGTSVEKAAASAKEEVISRTGDLSAKSSPGGYRLWLVGINALTLLSFLWLCVIRGKMRR